MIFRFLNDFLISLDTKSVLFGIGLCVFFNVSFYLIDIIMAGFRQDPEEN